MHNNIKKLAKSGGGGGGGAVAAAAPTDGTGAAVLQSVSSMGKEIGELKAQMASLSQAVRRQIEMAQAELSIPLVSARQP